MTPPVFIEEDEFFQADIALGFSPQYEEDEFAAADAVLGFSVEEEDEFAQADVALGFATPEEPEKPGLFGRAVDFAGSAIEKGKEFVSGLFQEGAAQPDPSLTPQEIPESGSFVPIAETVEGFDLTDEERQELQNFAVERFGKEPFPQITNEDRKAMAQILIKTGNETLAGKLVQRTAAVGRGLLKSIPGVQTILPEFAESAQGQALEKEFPAEAIAGSIIGTMAQVIAGGAGTAAALAKTAIGKSPVLMTTMARVLPATVLRGAQTAEQISQGKIDIKDGLINTLVESGGGAAFSIIPEIIFSPGVAQLIVQPLADIVYQAGVDIARGKGKDVLGPEWFKEQIPTIAASLGFAIKDVSTGAEFKSIQKAQRAEISKWMGGKGEAGFEIVTTPEGMQVLGKQGVENIDNIIKAEETRLKAEEAVDRPTQVIKTEDVAKFKPEKDVTGAEILKPAKPFKPSEVELAKLDEPEKVPVGPVNEPEAKEQLPVSERGDIEVSAKPKPEEKEIPVSKGTEAEKEQLVTAHKKIRKETETVSAARESQIEKLDVELERVESASEVRKSLTGFEEKAITGKQLDLITGKKTRDRRGNLITRTEATEKVLQGIADDYNLAKAEGEGATTRLLPSDRVLQSVDNWSADDVADLISEGLNVRKFKEFKADIEGRREGVELESEKAFEDIGKRGEEISAKMVESGIGPTGEERFIDFFDTGQREGILEGETGAFRPGDIIPRRQRIEQRTGASIGTKRGAALGKFIQRNFTTKGDFPQEVFTEKIAKDGWINAELKDIENNVGDFRRATGKKKLSDKEAFDIDLVFKGEKPINVLPSELQPIIREMRNHVDALSQRLIDEGVIEGDLAGRVLENVGFYATRSFRAFDDPKWSDKVPVDVRNRAKAFVRQELLKQQADIKSKMDELLSRRNDIVSTERIPDKTTKTEEGILRTKKATEKVVDKSESRIKRRSASIKMEMQIRRDAVQKQIENINERKTKVWRERPITAESKAALEKKKNAITDVINKLTEENEINEDIILQVDELQGELSKSIESILKLPTRLQDIGAVMAKFSSKVNNLSGTINKSKIVEKERILNAIKTIEKQAQTAFFRINEKRTGIFRAEGEDVDAGAKGADERLAEIDTKIDELNEKVTDITDDVVDGMIDELLYKEGAPVNILSSGSKLGARNLSILKARKDIPPEIRALWGEYKNADVNYARSVAKMGQLLANNRFLTNVGEAGAEKFFFKEPVVKGGVSYSVKISSEGNPSMKPLDGTYTTKEIKKAFEGAVAKQNDPEWLKAYLKLNSTVKYAKTIGSAMTHVRNVTGNISFAIANGHFNVAEMGNAIKTTMGDLTGNSSKEMRSYIRELVKLGVVADGARSGEIRAIIADASQGNTDVIMGSGNRRLIQRGLKTIEKLYGAEDDVWKIYAYENELKRYSKANTGMSDAELKKYVATIVRDTYPTYSMIPRAIKGLRRFPLVGTFVSFPAEVIRTAKNSIQLTGKELSSKNAKIRAIGVQRLTGLMLAATATAGITAASRYMFGITRRKDEAVREFLPPWAENSQLIYTSQVEDGKGTYVDLGYTDPHSYLKNPIIAFMRGEDWESKIMETGAEMLSPFLSEDIMTQKLLDVSRNKTKDGQPIWNEQDDILNKRWDMLAHVAEGIEPGTIAGIRRIWKATKQREGRFGTSYDVKTEIAAQTTGVRVSTLDVKRSLQFKTFKFQREIREAARLARKKNIPTSFTAKKRIFTDFADVMRDAKLTGLTQIEINQALNDAGMSWNNIAYLQTGIYELILKSKEMVAELKEPFDK